MKKIHTEIKLDRYRYGEIPPANFICVSVDIEHYLQKIHPREYFVYYDRGDYWRSPNGNILTDEEAVKNSVEAGKFFSKILAEMNIPYIMHKPSPTYRQLFFIKRRLTKHEILTLANLDLVYNINISGKHPKLSKEHSIDDLLQEVK